MQKRRKAERIGKRTGKDKRKKRLVLMKKRRCDMAEKIIKS